MTTVIEFTIVLTTVEVSVVVVVDVWLPTEVLPAAAICRPNTTRPDFVDSNAERVATINIERISNLVS
jgi:hypothetical protein